MVRIFGILSAIAVFMILFAGGGIYWVTQSDVNSAKHNAIESLAQGITISVSRQVNTLQMTVNNFSRIPEVIDAIESQNPDQMELVARKLEKILPKTLKIRILPADVTELDHSAVPHMGNADLIMIQDTLKKAQPPFIQGQGKNRHLAITTAVKKEGKSIGVILASLKFDFLQTILKTSKIKGGFLDLKQNKASLARAGLEEDKAGEAKIIKVSRTPWAMHFWTTSNTSLTAISTFLGIVIIPVLSCLLAFFAYHRKLTRFILKDQGSILKAIKDLMSGKKVGSYPLNLNEMQPIIGNIIQYKRVLDNEGFELSHNEGGDTEIDDFFDDSPMDVSFLDNNIEVEPEVSSFDSIDSSPLKLPEIEETNTTPENETVFDTNQNLTAAQSKQSSIYKAYDIRGVAGKTLTEDIIYNIGRAIGSEAKEKSIKTIILGRDGRVSSPGLSQSFSKGVISTGVNILDIGLVPSPVVYFVTQHTEGKTGVVITGSHNPSEYNGLKIIINGETLANDKIQQIKQRIDDNNYLTGETGTIDENSMFINEYIGIIAEDIHIERPMKVVVDCGNGSTGDIVPTLLKTLGCEVIELFCDIDGTFPNHHPDPSNPRNLSDLITAVHHYDADIGVAFDGDGDRLGVVDCKGKIIWPDRQMMLYAKNVLSKKPGAEIIFDVKCSSHLGQQITKNGGRPIMWKTGHSLMKSKLKETGAALAGEMSGHIFFNDRWFGFDDALYSASRLIEILAADTRNSNEVFADFPDSINTPEINIEVAEGENFQIMEQLFSNASFSDGKITNIDGLRVDFDDGWGLVRASNTMPALVLRFEADSKEIMERIQTDFRKILMHTKSDLKIPF